MFKFLKSKKGFTLVELMIVVVIMAILVAVAVPIYSAVTKNARVKTCAGNRREIVSQVNNFIMGSVDGKQHTESGSFKISSDGEKGTFQLVNGETVYTETRVKGLFQELPYCPAGGDAAVVYEVKIEKKTATGEADIAKVTVICPKHTDANGAALADGEAA